MKGKNHIEWYSLPQGYRNNLKNLNEIFETMRHEGAWGIQKEILKYGKEAIAVIRRNHCLYYDSMMPRLSKVIESKKLRIAIFPVGMKIVDIVFYKPYSKNNVKGKHHIKEEKNNAEEPVLD